ncbi:MAG TPA: SDR family NAD(P)-dependent oxidoreductase, partial [Trebonia sp.]
PADPESGSWRPSGTALVTGGTGAIGGHVARLLATRGAPRVVLTSRSGPAAAGAAALAAALAAAGTSVTVAACDSARRAELAGLLDGIAAGGPPLRSVFHAAGNAPGQRVNDIAPADLDVTLAVKAGGASHLDELTLDTGLDAFVLFSSGSATWGSAGLGSYAAANAYLDALADNRRARGLAGTSVAWGLWGGGGLGDGAGGTALQRLGLRDMDPDLAVAALAQSLDADETTLTVADVDWGRFAPVFTLRRPSPLLAGLPEARQATDDAVSAAGPDTGTAASELAGRLAGLHRGAQLRLLTDLVRAQVAAVLGHASADAVEAARAFKDLGFDSVTALELRRRVAAATGLTLPATLVYDYPSSAALAASLHGLLLPDDGSDGQPPVLAELARLGATLRDQRDASPGLRDDITRTLRGLLAGWADAGDDPGPQADRQAALAFETATQDQVFDFLDKELGLPGSAL